MGRKCLCFCDLLAATQIVLKADLFLPHFKMGMIHLLQSLSLPRASNVQMFNKTFWQPLQQQSFSIVNPDGASINKRSRIHLDQNWQRFRFPICNLLPSLAQPLRQPSSNHNCIYAIKVIKTTAVCGAGSSVAFTFMQSTPVCSHGKSSMPASSVGCK